MEVRVPCIAMVVMVPMVEMVVAVAMVDTEATWLSAA
jgi:hypothetical protein